MQRIQQCGERLEPRGKNVTSNFSKRIKNCKMELKQLRNKRDEQSILKYVQRSKEAVVPDFGSTRNLLEAAIETAMAVSGGQEYQVFPCFSFNSKAYE